MRRFLLPLTIFAAALLLAVGGAARITQGSLEWLVQLQRIVMPVSALIVIINAVAAWRDRALDPTARKLSIAAALLLAMHALVSALVHAAGADALLIAANLAVGYPVLACLVAASWFARLSAEQERATSPKLRSLQRTAWVTLGASWLLVIAGGLVAGFHAELACYGFPECNGMLVPTRGGLPVALHLFWRSMTLVVMLLALATAWQAARLRQATREVRMLSLASAMITIVLGMLSVGAINSGFVQQMQLNLLLISIVQWAMVTAVLALVLRQPLEVAPLDKAAAERLRAEAATKKPSLIADYISLTKPRVISLLLVTTWAGMYITGKGQPSLSLVFWTLLGGYLASGGAGAMNCAIDEHIDQLMGRTGRRPVPSGRIPARNAFLFGFTLSILSFFILWHFANLLAAILAMVGVIYYVLIYTIWLKKMTWQNIVIGGGAGAIPPLVGWAAVAGELNLAAVLLFVIIFYWTPPHFWALALVKEKDYARAGVPMLPVIAGEAHTRWQILLYSFLMVAVTLLLTPIQAMGWVYLLSALLLGGWFLVYAWRVWRSGDQKTIWGLYKYSLLYLALLFAAMVVDRLILV